MNPFIHPGYTRPERFGQCSAYLAARRPTANDQIERKISSIDVVDRMTWALKTAGMTACVGANVAGFGMMTLGSSGAGVLREALVGHGHVDPHLGGLSALRAWGLTGGLVGLCMNKAAKAREQEHGLVEAVWAGVGMGLFAATEYVRIVHNLAYLMIEGAGAIAGASAGLLYAGCALGLDELRRFLSSSSDDAPFSLAHQAAL